MKKILLLGVFLFSIFSSNYFYLFDVEKGRLPLILGGVGMAIIGNQDRQTDSGKLLQIGGIALALTFTF